MRMPLEMERKMKQEQVIAYAVKHLPIIKEFAVKMGIVDIINRMIPSQMDEDPGTIFLAMILDTLSGRTPLYRLDEFFENQDTELLLGKDVKPEAFKDYSLARVLDKAYEAGTIRIFTEISKRAVFLFDIDATHASFDTTSINVCGDYEAYSEESSSPFRITHGHSKDHRPDLKQFLISMLCVDKNIPIIGKTEDGNGSDKTINNEVLSSVSKHMAKYGISEKAYIYIADSAMVTKKNLDQIGDSIYFISRLPATYKECARAVKHAVKEDDWEDVGILAVTKPTKKRPAAHYKVHETKVNLHGKNYRAIVVHSSAHDKRRKKRIDRELARDRRDMETDLKKLSQKEFFCFDDAEKEMKEWVGKKSKYHSIEARVNEIPKYKRGRPKNGVKEIDRTLYSVQAAIVEKKDKVERFKEEAGCFVLLSNVPAKEEMAHTPTEILQAYKDQYGIEQNFGFLKDPVIVNSIFLKKAERIEVLGLILLISLLIWRLLERTMRNFIAQEKTDLPGWKRRRTTRPTSFMLTTKFIGIIVLNVAGVRMLNKPLTEQQKEYLYALGIRFDVFTNPKIE